MKNSLLLFVLFISNFHFSQQLLYNKDTVGFIYSINANYAELSYDITLTSSLTKYELNKVKSTYNLKIDKVIYDFKLPSDYLKQSTIFRERAIKTRVATSLIGFGLGVVGGVIVSQSSTTTNNQNRNIGLAVSGVGGAITVGGLLFTIKLNLSANDMLRRGAQEYRKRGL